MTTMGASTQQNGGATRSSLACLPCRSRHLKCDGERPQCNRCVGAATECHYAPSRRGGLDRAALAERRKRLAAAGNAMAVENPIPHSLVGVRSGQPPGAQIIDESFNRGVGSLDTISLGNGSPQPRVSSVSQGQLDNIEDDPLIDAYYQSFHVFHPFLVPRKHLHKLHHEPSRQASFKPLVAVMRLIGNIYAVREWSSQLKDRVENDFSEAVPTDPTMVQCRLLYSMALFWYSYRVEAKEQMNVAVRLAFDLEMFQEEFARTHGAEDSVLIESWRRTWWELYIIDAYYAGTLGTMNFAVVDVEATVELPCEEWEYESGDIPEPKRLEDFDSREFASEDTSFSSFAYLISAVKCAALAISTAPKIATRADSELVIQAADSVIDGWSLLLPKDRKQVITKTGEIDELMFQAHLVINVATIGLHRPLSDLRFNPVEDVSSCAREPPPEVLKPELVNVHTVRVLRSVEAQIRLLALPVRPFNHSPFVTCMTSEGTLALLSACNFLFKGKELAIARDQIRMTIGCLKTLGEFWPRTAKNVQEIQTIARHVLRLGSKETSGRSTQKSSRVPSLSGAQGSLGAQSITSTSENDMFSALGPMEDVCGWYSLEDLGPQFAEWMGNESQ